MPTFTQLQYIVAVDRLRHFARAAKQCHVSQPSLSMQIQKVEEILGFPIFDRLKKPVLATERGRVFIEQAKKVLQEHQRLLDLASQQEASVSGEFRLGIIPTLAPYLLPLFIEDFSERFPRVKLWIDELKTETIIQRLREDTLDAGILATPLKEDGIQEKILFYEPFYFYAGKDHPLMKKKKISESELEGIDMWLLADGHCLRNQIVRFCSSLGGKGVFRNVQFEGGNLETLRYLVKKSRGCTLITQLFYNTLPETEKRDQVREFAHITPSREVSLVYRRGQWKADLLKAVAETIIKNIPDNLLKKPEKNIQVLEID